MDEPHKRKDWPTDPVQVCSPVCGPNTTRRILISPPPPPHPMHSYKAYREIQLGHKTSFYKEMINGVLSWIVMTKKMWTLTLHSAWLYHGKTIFLVCRTNFAVFLSQNIVGGQHQRVLNDLWRARFSCGRIDLAPSPPPVSMLDRRHTGRLRKRDNLLTGGGGGRGGWQRAESYDHKKARSSINYLILSGRHSPSNF